MIGSTYHQWINDWNWIITVAAKRGWDIGTGLSISPPCSLIEVKEVEHAAHLILPEEFIKTLTEFSSAVSFQWIMSEDDQEHTHELFSGGSLPLWNLDSLKECKETYMGWIECCFPDPQ